jgi:hypothetical protein
MSTHSQMKQTRAQRWLAAGHRYDDLDLWRELCERLEAHGLTPTTALPEHLAPLVLRDPENAYLAWLRDELLLPVIHQRSGPARWR